MFYMAYAPLRTGSITLVLIASNLCLLTLETILPPRSWNCWFPIQSSIFKLVAGKCSKLFINFKSFKNLWSYRPFQSRKSSHATREETFTGDDLDILLSAISREVSRGEARGENFVQTWGKTNTFGLDPYVDWAKICSSEKTNYKLSKEV